MLSLGLRRVVTSEFREESLSGPLGLIGRKNREQLVGYGWGELKHTLFYFYIFYCLETGSHGPRLALNSI